VGRGRFGDGGARGRTSAGAGRRGSVGGVPRGRGLVRGGRECGVGRLESERWRGRRQREGEGTDGTLCRRKASSAGVMKFGM